MSVVMSRRESFHAFNIAAGAGMDRRIDGLIGRFAADRISLTRFLRQEGM